MRRSHSILPGPQRVGRYPPISKGNEEAFRSVTGSRYSLAVLYKRPSTVTHHETIMPQSSKYYGTKKRRGGWFHMSPGGETHQAICLPSIRCQSRATIRDRHHMSHGAILTPLEKGTVFEARGTTNTTLRRAGQANLLYHALTLEGLLEGQTDYFPNPGLQEKTSENAGTESSNKHTVHRPHVDVSRHHHRGYLIHGQRLPQPGVSDSMKVKPRPTSRMASWASLLWSSVRKKKDPVLILLLPTRSARDGYGMRNVQWC